MSVLAAVLAATRSIIPAPENELREPTLCMKEVIAHTHYHPQRWRHKGYGSFDVREEFLGLYPYVIESFFSEMLGIAFTPLALAFTLPRVRRRCLPTQPTHAHPSDRCRRSVPSASWTTCGTIPPQLTAWVTFSPSAGLTWRRPPPPHRQNGASMRGAGPSLPATTPRAGWRRFSSPSCPSLCDLLSPLRR